MKEFIEDNKKMLSIILIILILIIILTTVINILGRKNTLLINSYVSKLDSKNIHLENTSCDLEKVLKDNNIPYFNLNNDVYNKLNKEILTDFLLRACYQNGEINYEASLNNNILSLAVKISYETTDDLTFLEYKTYNINTNTNSLINNQDILNLYNLTKNQVEEKVLNKLKTYYDYEKSKHYLNNESFNDFLNILEYKPITIDNMNLYIDSKNDLYIYKDYILSEGMSIDDPDYPYITIKFKLS